MIDRERLLRTFLELVAIDSPSGAEDSLARDLKLRLLTLGGQVEQDGHGNVVARWPQDSGEWLLLSAHMDTNGRDVGIRPQVRVGVVYSDGSTILGADDKSGISVIREVLHSVASGSLVAPALEVVFTVEAETGLVGARRLDKGSLRSRRGYVADGDGHAQRLEIGTPTKDGVTATVRGRRSHASKASEAGIDAIRVAAQAIASMPLGRLDRSTTANIGRIEGGSAPNMVADEVCLSGEARNHDLALLTAQVNTMISCLANAGRRHAASVEISINTGRDRLRAERRHPCGRPRYGDGAAQWHYPPSRWELHYDRRQCFQRPRHLLCRDMHRSRGETHAQGASRHRRNGHGSPAFG